MIWHIIKYLISVILPSFYSRIQGKNAGALQVDAPVIIAMNHPNAFTDPILFSYVTYPIIPKYLARGDAFKPGLASYFLERLGIIPIFRIQDGGKEGLKKNDDAYRRVNYFLSKNQKVIVFAEGLCIQERRLRPLKKGVARMVFGAYDFLKNDKLLVIPVGVNYSAPSEFRSTVFYNVGEPLAVKDFYTLYQENPARAYNTFLQVLEPKMKDLITHINNPANDNLVVQLEKMLAKQMILAWGKSASRLENVFEASKEITKNVNDAEVNCPEILLECRKQTDSYFKELIRLKINDEEVHTPPGAARVLLYTVGVFLFSPIYLTGYLGFLIPKKLTELIVRKLVRAKEFYSSFFLGIAMILVWTYLTLVFLLVYSYSETVLRPFLAVIVLFLCGWFYLHFRTIVMKFLSMLRAVKNKQQLSSLIQKRTGIVNLVNKFSVKHP